MLNNQYEGTRKKFRWVSLVFGLIMAVLGLVVFMHPYKFALTITWLFSLAILLNGIISFIFWYDIGRDGYPRPGVLLIDAILDIILAVLVLTSSGPDKFVMLGYMFAFWFIFDSATSLSMASLSFHPGFNMVLGVLGLIMGVIMLFTPMIGAVTVAYLAGAYLLVFGILLVSRAF
ncbi:HdeD family acid-resistance protein [Xylocopilactobacillus apicola]|uniref:HdeD family acid-resistance protein n=1 Tax=Xylocopilactobacillus apicola TaxID=2932184 RepID=A0AAU9DHS5_9LACO|nr:DUF308 domain-containing protein [Xylocopilactobacillus apicola]BDR57871.1 HdeD family acid-resistance protein [Xylocopilactobacillus apicola]